MRPQRISRLCSSSRSFGFQCQGGTVTSGEHGKEDREGADPGAGAQGDPGCGLEEGTPGHGCSHNLLGVGSAVAAVAAARVLQDKRLPGRIVLWGCPAEEPIAGKPFMARDGAFRQQDAVPAWHPGAENQVRRQAGAIATETRMKVTLLAGAYDRLPNEVVADVTQRNMDLFGPPQADDADRDRGFTYDWPIPARPKRPHRLLTGD